MPLASQMFQKEYFLWPGNQGLIFLFSFQDLLYESSPEMTWIAGGKKNAVDEVVVMVAKEALQVTKWPSAKICQVIASIPGFTIRPFFAKKALRKPEPLFTVYEFPHAPNHLHCTVYSIQYTQFIRIILAWYQVNEPFHFGTCFITESGYVTWPKLSGSLGFAQRNTSHQPFELKSEYVTHNYPFQIYALPPTRCYIATWNKIPPLKFNMLHLIGKIHVFRRFSLEKGRFQSWKPMHFPCPLVHHTEACDSELTADHTGVRITVGGR